ncbi:MAG: hypothetical protein F6K09_02585 [Merismopedia sp. SIO2A8]|nr:hypothetical protein [Merismopedia sp. SIO2A8]
MAHYTITLSEETYNRLLSAAHAQGITPEHWIDAQLPNLNKQHPPLLPLLNGLIGAIDSKNTPLHQPTKSKLGEAIAKKLAKQGIQRP